MLSSDCDASFAPISLTDDQRVVLSPTKRYLRSASLLGAPNYHDNDKEDAASTGDEPRPTRTVSMSFRTLVGSATLLTVKQEEPSSARTVVEIIDGVLGFFSDPRSTASLSTSTSGFDVSAAAVSPAINMSSGVRVDDGQWHSFALETAGPVLRLWVDGAPAGYELESSATHDFIGTDVEQFVLGEEGVRQNGGGKIIYEI